MSTTVIERLMGTDLVRAWPLEPFTADTWPDLDAPMVPVGKRMLKLYVCGFDSSETKPEKSYYWPTEDDIERVKELYPTLGDPQNPPWCQMRADLISAGRPLGFIAGLDPVAALLFLGVDRRKAKGTRNGETKVRDV